jgi:ABC-2 type transport system permease protein
VGIIVVAGRVLFGIGWPKDWAELVVYVAAGVGCLAALGVAYSHVIPNFDAAPAFTNIVFLPVIFISGVFYDASDAPQALHDIARVLPLTHIIDGLSAALVNGKSLGDTGGGLAVVALWGVFGLVFAVRGFSWDQRRS